MKIKLNFYCNHCGFDRNYESEYDAPYVCPECDSDNTVRSRTGICEECGREVDLRGFTNECVCGALYNNSGQRLADPSEWDDDDRYDCFGPQNGGGW